MAINGSPVRRFEWPRELPTEMRLHLIGLTRREAEVASLAACGLLVTTIAQRMQVSPATVKTLLARAREKLGCRTVRELTTVLLREGIIQPEELPDPREHRAALSGLSRP